MHTRSCNNTCDMTTTTRWIDAPHRYVSCIVHACANRYTTLRPSSSTKCGEIHMQLKTGGSGHGSGKKKDGKPLVFSTCPKTSHVVSTCQLRRQHRLTTALRPRWTGQPCILLSTKSNQGWQYRLRFLHQPLPRSIPTETHQSNIATELKGKQSPPKKPRLLHVFLLQNHPTNRPKLHSNNNQQHHSKNPRSPPDDKVHIRDQGLALLLFTPARLLTRCPARHTKREGWKGWCY
jgi:hypothetical protein